MSEPLPPQSESETGESPDETASESTVTHTIARTLQREILQGQYRQGDRLPGSRSLARQFNASINTVQAALGRLQAMDMIVCRPRRRAIVGSARRLHLGRKSRHGPVVMLTEPGGYYPTFQTSWGAQILFAAQHVLAEADMTVATTYIPTVNHKIPPEVQDHAAELLRMAGGVIWLASSGMQPQIIKTMERGVPVVSVNAPADVIESNVVKADNLAAGRLVGRVFSVLGYHRCLILTRGIRLRRFAPELAQGFIDSFMKEGIPLRGVEYRELDDNREELAHEAVKAFLADNPPPQGIFAVSDPAARGAIRAVQEHGLRIPQDVGVVSAVGFEECRQHRPRISAWRQPTAELGAEAARMLLKLMAQPDLRLPPVLVPSTLTIRETLPHHPALADLPGVEMDDDHGDRPSGVST